MLSNLIEPININSSNSTIHLSKGIYDIYILGGWEIKLGKFNFQLKSLKNDSIIKPQKSLLRIQNYYRGKKAKKIFSVTIINGGEFMINFENQNDLIVNKTFLSSLLFWQKPLNTKYLEIKFERN